MKIIDNAKEIAGLIKKYNNMDLDRKILDLQGEIINLTNEKRDLEDENRKLKEKLSLRKKMTYKKPYWFQEGDEVPFCPLCYERDGKPIHLQGPYHSEYGQSPYFCPSCNQSF